MNAFQRSIVSSPLMFFRVVVFAMSIGAVMLPRASVIRYDTTRLSRTQYTNTTNGTHNKRAACAPFSILSYVIRYAPHSRNWCKSMSRHYVSYTNIISPSVSTITPSTGAGIVFGVDIGVHENCVSNNNIMSDSRCNAHCPIGVSICIFKRVYLVCDQSMWRF